MVVGSGGALPIVGDQAQIEIPAGDFGCAVLEFVDRTLGESDGGEVGRAAEAFLGAGVEGIDLPVIDIHGDTAEAGDGVDEVEGVGMVLVDELADFQNGIADARGGFGVDDRDQGVGFLREVLVYLGEDDGRSPVEGEGVHVGT